MSLHAPVGIDEFELAMVDMVEKESEREELPEFILNERHGEIAKATLAEMREALSAWERAEIAAMHIRGAIGYFDEIFGKSDMEGIMNGIFEKFCVGK